jgi:ABC-type sugar transport system ATPase subunit
VSFTLITHHINEIIDFCDRVTVMRDGRAVRTLEVGETSKEELAAWIVGDEETFRSRAPRAPEVAAPAGIAAPEATVEPVLSVEGLTSTAFEGVTFDLQPGEILGVAGLDGSGKDEVLMALVGLVPINAGVVRVGSAQVAPKSPQQAGKLGIAYLPKKREEFAVLQHMSVQDNTLLPIYPSLRSRFGLIDDARAKSVAEDGLRSLQVKTPSLRTVIDALSGGNRQKVVLLRVMLRKPRVFLLNEPTRGVDLATKPEILKTIRLELAAQGGVVMTAESEEELVETCDRILVMYRGRVRRELRRAQPEFSPAEVYRTIQGVGL